MFESPVEGEASAALTIPIQQEWDGTRKRRFRALAEKEALETASKGELEELEELSALRRNSQVSRRGEEVLREYEQGQLVRDLLGSLSRYVEFESKARIKDGASKTRSRAKTKA